MLWKATEFLYWGDMSSPQEYKQYGIKSIICVADELPTPEVDLPFIKIPILNGHPATPIIKDIFLRIAHILTCDFPLLVYCQAGCNRSAGLVFLWLVEHGYTRESAWVMMRTLRPDVLSWSQHYNKIVELGE